MSRGPTVQRRRLAAELRSQRDHAGLTPDDAARAADISKSALWRLESGSVKPRVPVVRSLLLAYGADPDLTAVLLQLARDAGQPGWWHQYGGAYPDWFEVYIGLEGEATELCMYQIQLIPGILQTEAYARAIITADHGDKPTSEIDRMVRFRMARRSVLDRPEPSALRIVLDEAALHRVVGGPEVMRSQLEYLLTIADHPAVYLRILPFDAGAHPAMGTPFTILTFDQDPAVVYLENFVSAVYPERPDQLTRFTLAFSHLCDAALTPAQSAEAIRDRMMAITAIGEESAR